MGIVDASWAPRSFSGHPSSSLEEVDEDWVQCGSLRPLKGSHRPMARARLSVKGLSVPMRSKRGIEPLRFTAKSHEGLSHRLSHGFGHWNRNRRSGRLKNRLSCFRQGLRKGLGHRLWHPQRWSKELSSESVCDFNRDIPAKPPSLKLLACSRPSS